MKARFYIFRLLVTGSILFFSTWLNAQETDGGLTGKITDAKGDALASAGIIAIHTASGTRYNAMSFKDGHYRIAGLKIGVYTVQVSYVGLHTAIRENIQVSLGEPQVVSFVLTDSGDALQEVVVKGAAKSTRLNGYGAGQNISRNEIKNMASISRSLQDMTRLVPQASRDNSFGGSNFRYNNVTIDGAINNDAIGFSPSLGGQTGTSAQPGSSTRTNPVSLDAIEDMQVYLAPYDARIGNFTGGSVNAVTRSGTNTVHGSIYGFGRNGSITGPDNAGDHQKMPHDFYEYQTGFRVGFPVIKNKLFFFTNEEVTYRQDPILVGAGTQQAAGILSAEDAKAITDTLMNRYGFDAGTSGNYNIYARSAKYFNRLDWNISPHHQLVLRNNTIFSKAVNLERDQQNFRFSSIAYEQINNQSSTVAELKSRFSNRIANSLLAGYTDIHDYRNPLSDAAFPQVQIVGRTPGSTIFLGTDREASIFNMHQKTIELTDNFTYNTGKHHIVIGTHNELYRISYGFVNSWNGRVDYPSIEDFLANRPNRVRGSFNYDNNDRQYILDHPTAVFDLNFFSAYLQDEILATDRLRVTVGFRVDYTDVPEKPVLSTKTSNTNTDINYGNTYFYTSLNRINNHFLGKPQASPRLGFRYNLTTDGRLLLRGGAGLFTGRIPFAWIGYAYYNNGDTYGAYDQRTDNGSSQFLAGTDPLRVDHGQGIAGFAVQNGQAVNNKFAGKTQVDVIDNHFVMPQVFRSSLAVEYTDDWEIKYRLEGIYTKVIKDVKFQQINIKDLPTYYVYDSAQNQRQQPISPSGGNNPVFANAYELSNTTSGYRYSITAQVSKRFVNGPDVMVAYTYGRAKDISNGVRNSMESNWQLNQSLNPNNPAPANSNFDIRHRIVGNIAWRIPWQQNLASTFSLFVNAQSGSPYTYGFINYTVQNTPQQVSLAYIPYAAESINFFRDYIKEGVMIRAADQAQAFNDFISSDHYLSSRRGQFTERNAGRTPWNVQADFRFSQDWIFRSSKNAQHMITFTYDIMNLTNLLNSNWGWVYFSPNTYNSTASVGLLPYIPARSSQGYPLYQFVNPGKPYSVDAIASRWQMQFGLRYSF